MKLILNRIIKKTYQLKHTIVPFKPSIKEHYSKLIVNNKTLSAINLSAYSPLKIKIANIQLAAGNFYNLKSHPYCIIYSLYVVPRFQNMGIAIHLVNKGIAIAKSRNLKEILLFVNYQNHKAISLYKRLSFTSTNNSLFKDIYNKELSLYQEKSQDLIGLVKRIG
jgi:ribosomal protein S18 acetylase RimI-like enzyme